MIGVFDSGVGGLSVLAQIRRLLPTAELVYLADTAHAPYGQRSLSEVKGFAEDCVGRLVGLGAEVIVIACNTASAAALHHLRRVHPGLSFVGMEPALKPAASYTRSGVVGVLATTATFQGELFASVVGRYGDSLEVIARPCPGWADLVEEGMVGGSEVARVVATDLDPVLAAGADTLVLGCTHYPFLRPVIEERAGAQVVIVDPAPGVARQVARLWSSDRSGGGTLLLTTGDPHLVGAVMTRLTGWDQPVTAVV